MYDGAIEGDARGIKDTGAEYSVSPSLDRNPSEGKSDGTTDGSGEASCLRGTMVRSTVISVLISCAQTVAKPDATAAIPNIYFVIIDLFNHVIH